MTDQEWEVDGGAGEGDGARGGAAKTTSPPGRSGSRPANVVPFPGNWFGSTDELVPIRTERPAPVDPVPFQPKHAWSNEPAPAAREGAAPEITASAAPSHAPVGGLADASAFWEGAASPLQDVVESLSTPVAPAGSTAWAPPATPSESTVQRDRGAESRLGSGASRGNAAHLRARTLALGVAVVVAGVAGVVVAARFIPGRPNPHGATSADRVNALGAGRHGPVVTETVASSVTVTRTVPERASRPATRRKADRRIPSQTRTTGSYAGSRPSTAVGSVPPVTTAGSASTGGASSAGPAVGAAKPAATATTSASRCAQSPDSGCLP